MGYASYTRVTDIADREWLECIAEDTSGFLSSYVRGMVTMTRFRRHDDGSVHYGIGESQFATACVPSRHSPSHN